MSARRLSPWDTAVVPWVLRMFTLWRTQEPALSLSPSPAALEENAWPNVHKGCKRELVVHQGSELTNKKKEPPLVDHPFPLHCAGGAGGPQWLLAPPVGLHFAAPARPPGPEGEGPPPPRPRQVSDGRRGLGGGGCRARRDVGGRGEGRGGG